MTTSRTSRDGEQGVAPVQVRGPVLTVRRIDAYHALTMVAPAIASRFRPGPVRHGRRRRPGKLDAAAPCLHHPRRAPRPRRHGRVRLRGRGAGHPLAGQPPQPGHAGRGRAARPAVPGPARIRELPAGRRGGGQHGAVPAGGPAARARLPGRLPARRAQRGPRVRCAARPAHRPQRDDHHRGRVAGHPRGGHRHAQPGHPRGPHRRHLRVGAAARAAGRDRAGRPLRHPRAGLRARGRWAAGPGSA